MKYNDKWAISEFEPKTDVLWVQPSQDEEDESIKINAFVNGKWRAVSNGENYPPEDGIPVTDLDADVQSSLSKADTAYQKPTTGIPASDLASGVQTSLGKADTALQTIKTVNGQSLVGSGDIEILEPGTIETLVIDGTPTAGSSNLITSGGVASEIVWDVTARNSNATFASLSALLSNANLATLIPTDVRKGGMQIRFVLSSDNNYVQYLYKVTDAATAATFTNVANWEKINLEDEIRQYCTYDNPQMFDEDSKDIVENKYIAAISNGEVVWNNFNGFNESGYVQVTPGTKVYKTDFDTAGNIIRTDWGYLAVCFFDENKTPIRVDGNPSSLGYVAIQDNIHYIRFCYANSNKVVISERANVTQYYEYIEPGYSIKNKIEDVNINLQEQIDDIEDDIDSINQRIADITEDGSQWIGKTWYAYGTSITSSAQGKYVPYLAAMSQMTAVNKGIPGGGIGDLGGYSQGQVRAAIMNTTDGKLNADLITLEVGANDTGADVPLGTIYDTDETTLCGCLNMCIRYLQQNTNAQVVIMPSPATTTIPNAEGKYYEAMWLFKKVCFINKCWWIDGMTNLGTAKILRTDIRYVQDNIHQTELGGYVFAKAIWAELMKIPTFDITLPNL